MPRPADLGSCFRFSDTVNLCAADAILSRAQRSSVDAHPRSNLVPRPNVDAAGSTAHRHRSAATSATYRQRHAFSHTRVHVYVHSPWRNRSSSSKNGAGRLGRCSLRVPETMGADAVSVPDRNRIRYAMVTWVSYGPRSTAVVSLIASREGCPRVRRWWVCATEFVCGAAASIIVYALQSLDLPTIARLYPSARGL